MVATLEMKQKDPKDIKKRKNRKTQALPTKGGENGGLEFRKSTQCYDEKPALSSTSTTIGHVQNDSLRLHDNHMIQGADI